MSRKERIDMTGVRHGRLVGLEYSHTSPSGRAQWRFRCDCGATTVADGGNVRAGTTTSCGCRHREISAARLTVHGHRAGHRHDATYRAWQQAEAVRRPPAAPWATSYPAFLRTLGVRPPGTVLAWGDAGPESGAADGRWVPVANRAARARRGWRHRLGCETGARAEPGDPTVTVADR